MLNIHSGLPNPSWRMTARELRELRHRLALAERLDDPDATASPLAAIFLKNDRHRSDLPDTIDLGGGRMIVREGPSAWHGLDRGDLAGWLKVAARDHGFRKEAALLD